MGYQFKGYDWRELAHCWGIVSSLEWQETDISKQDTIIAEIRAYIHSSLGTEREHEVAKAMRSFIWKLSEQTPGYDGPIWHGMLKVQDDATLLHFSAQMIELMWT